MSDVAVWTCEFEPAPGAPKLDDLTVGAKFLLKCKGDLAVAWSADPLHIKFPKDEQAYALSILSADQLSPQSVQLTVTGYRAGEQTPDWFRVLQKDADGERGFEVVKPKWMIKSVLAPGKPPQPYPSFGPWGLGLPMYLWVSFALAAALLLAAGGWFLLRLFQRRRVRETLRRHKTALSPAHQFYRDARAIRRRLDEATGPDVVRGIATDLAREFRMFLVREFEVPALDWSDAAVRRDLSRRHRAVDAAAGDALGKTLRELTRLLSRPAFLGEDVAQLLAMSLGTVEAVEAARTSLERRRR